MDQPETTDGRAIKFIARLSAIKLEAIGSNDEEHDLLVDLIDEAREILSRLES